MASGSMDCRTVDRLKGALCQRLLLCTILFTSFGDIVAWKLFDEQNHRSIHNAPSKSSSMGLFEPIQISPSVIPHYPIPSESFPPMYPTFPSSYVPVLTGKCPVNFSAISTIMEQTAADCSQPLAPLVGNVICCPQLTSLLRIFQGYYSINSGNLVMSDSLANNCFTDIISVLASRGANSTLPKLCSVKPSNLTAGSCPVKDLNSFEKFVNTTQLLDACSIVDPLRECCRPVCQPAIADAALQLSIGLTPTGDNKNIIGGDVNIDALMDCKAVVYSWLSRKLPADSANSAFRILTSCKVNRVCPLEFMQPQEVVQACRNRTAPSPSCCSSLNSYIGGIQKQMLITNKQAIICATMFASMLQKAGVMTDIYQLCDVDLKDFSFQVTAYGQQGCLLRSLPADVVFDNESGYSFTCDLNDNIGAPWPSSSSMSSYSICAPEMSLPAVPKSKKSGSPGHRGGRQKFVAFVFAVFVIHLIFF